MEDQQVLDKAVAVGCVALLVTLFLTPVMIRLGRRFGLVDEPNSRRIHSTPIPRSGGLAVIAGFYAGCIAILYLFDDGAHGGLDASWLAAFFVSSLVLAAVGLYDDKTGLRPRTKLVGQMAAATLMHVLADQSVGSILGFPLTPFWDFCLTVFWFLALINAFNLIDGLDGLCSGITTISALGLGVSFILRGAPSDTLVAFALAGAALGFLRHNFHPAKIFLGDTGSMFCGFALASIALATNVKSTLLVTVGIPMLAAGVPVMDTMLAIWRRSVRYIISRQAGSENPTRIMQPDRDHIHHRLLDLGLGQRQVAMMLYAGTLFFVVLGLLSVAMNKSVAGLFVIIITAGAYVIVRHVVHVELWDTGLLLFQRIHSPRRGFLSLLFYPLWDFCWLSAALLLAFTVTSRGHLFAPISSPLIEAFPQWLAPVFVTLVVGRAYSRVWFHSSIKDYLKLILSVAIGCVFSIGVVSFAEQDLSWRILNLGLLFCLFSFFGIVGIRAAAPFMREWMLTHSSARHRNMGRAAKKVLLYGAGSRGGLYMREKRFAYLDEDGIPTTVAGFIDDDPFLRKRYIHGLKVLGNSQELPDIIDARGINKIIVTADLTDDARKRLEALAKSKNVKLSIWHCSLEHVVVPQPPSGHRRSEDTAVRGEERQAAKC